MFRLELKATLRQTLFVMGFMVIMPLLYLLDSSVYMTGTSLVDYMLGGYGLLWLITAGCLAYNMFRKEDEDDAEEYLLSLPISRYNLLAVKTVPRFAVLAGLELLFRLLTGRQMWFSDFPGMIVFLICILLCGFMLGLAGRKSWIARLVLLVIAAGAFVVSGLPPHMIWNTVRHSSLPYYLGEMVILLVVTLYLTKIWDRK
ncbi:MAG: ABC transporter permease subunit, partial [Candidatus Aegiribacteria sp.]|nr:ABC transporter permease subunit [Candidatus Aegiribacteria sp.]MBD3294940.1 ABC transporter permease subunit [Candidatus Fermentibacteria bacterium]